MISPCWARVASLNCFTNIAMFTPCEPSAGPTGGAGVAWPAGHCSLILPVISFAIACCSWARAAPWEAARPSDLFHFPVLELDRRRTTEDRHHDAHRALLRGNVLDRTVEAVERPGLDLDHVALLQADRDLGPRLGVG